MKIYKLLSLFIIGLTYQFSFGQITEKDYLVNNSTDLLKPHNIIFGEAKIIGFGALHGSAKTEDTEIILLQNLVKKKDLKFYLPETDFSTANYFQEYIDLGDEELLKELVTAYGTMVPQEKSIEVFEKWKTLRPMFKENGVQILGVDKIASYKFTVKELLAITQNTSDWNYRDSLKNMVLNSETNWSAFYKTQTSSTLKSFVEDFENNKTKYQASIVDNNSFNHITKKH